MAKNDITINVGSKYNGEGLQKAEQAMAKAGAAASKASGQLKNITNALGGIPNSANQALNAVNKLGTAFAQGGVWGAGLAVVGLAITKISEHFEEARKRSLEFAKSIQDNISNAMDKVSEKVEHFSKTIKRVFDKKNFDIQIDTQNAMRDNKMRDLSRQEGYIEERKGMSQSQAQRSRIQEEYDNATKPLKDVLKVLQNDIAALQTKKNQNNLQITNLDEEKQASLDATRNLNVMQKFLNMVKGINSGKYDRLEGTANQDNLMVQPTIKIQNTGKQKATEEALSILTKNGYSMDQANSMFNAYQGNKDETNKAIEENQKKIEEQRKRRLNIQDSMNGYNDDNEKIDKNIIQKQNDIKAAEYEASVKTKVAEEKRAEALAKLEEQENKEVELIQKRLESLNKQLQHITDEEEKQKALESYDDEILKAKKKIKELQEEQEKETERMNGVLKRQKQDLETAVGMWKAFQIDYQPGESPKERRNRRREAQRAIRDEATNVLKTVQDGEKTRGDGDPNEFQGLGLQNGKVRSELIRRRWELIEKYGQKDKNGKYELDEDGSIKMSKRISKKDQETYDNIKTALTPRDESMTVLNLRNIIRKGEADLEKGKNNTKGKIDELNKQIEIAQNGKDDLNKKFRGDKVQDDKDKLNKEIEQENKNLNDKKNEIGQARNRKYGENQLSAMELMNIDPNSLKKRDKEALAQRKGSTLMTNELLEGMSKSIVGISKALGVKV